MRELRIVTVFVLCFETYSACSIMEGGEIKILIADDSEAFRRAVKDLLNENSGEWVVCGEATNGEDAVREVAELLPDVILLDLSIPLLHGLRIAKILKRDYPALAVIVMSEQDISVLSRMADALGTRYCISKARVGRVALFGRTAICVVWSSRRSLAN